MLYLVVEKNKHTQTINHLTEGTQLRITKLLSISLAITLATSLIGCASKGGDAAGQQGDMNTQSGTNSASISGQELGEARLTAEDAARLEAAGFQATNIIYFDYDSSQLKTDDEQTVDKHAQYLIDNPNIKIMLEGHADERGSREYNMALGEKRAYSIKELLQLKGVGKQQVQTVSFGEERPEISGHDETSWSKNRRAVFVYASN